MKRHVRRALAMVTRDHPARIGLVVLAPAAPEDQQVLAGAGGEHAHALARHQQPECQHILEEGACLFQIVDVETGLDDALDRRCAISTGIPHLPASERRSCVESLHETSSEQPGPAREAPHSCDLRLAAAVIGALERFSVGHGRTSPAGVASSSSLLTSRRERRRPWSQVIDPPQTNVAIRRAVAAPSRPSGDPPPAWNSRDHSVAPQPLPSAGK